MVFVGPSMPLGIVQYCGFLGKVWELVWYDRGIGMVAFWYCAALWISRFSVIGVLVWYAFWYCVVWWVSSPWETPHPHTQPAIMISPSLLSSSSSSTYYFSTSLCNHVGNTFVFLLTSVQWVFLRRYFVKLVALVQFIYTLFSKVFSNYLARLDNLQLYDFV